MDLGASQHMSRLYITTIQTIPHSSAYLGTDSTKSPLMRQLSYTEKGRMNSFPTPATSEDEEPLAPSPSRSPRARRDSQPELHPSPYRGPPPRASSQPFSLSPRLVPAGVPVEESPPAFQSRMTQPTQYASLAQSNKYTSQSSLEEEISDQDEQPSNLPMGLNSDLTFITSFDKTQQRTFDPLQHTQPRHPNPHPLFSGVTPWLDLR